MKVAHTLLEDLLGFDNLDLENEDHAVIPRHRLIYQRIRAAILNGKLQTGDPLPPSRHLARHLAVSRNTVLTAYDQLQAEGLVTSRQGSGTTVAVLPPPADSVMKPKADSSVVRIARRAQHLTDQSGIVTGARFLPGLPDMREFPYKIWSRLYNRHNRHIDHAIRGLDLGAGHLPLRQGLAQYLKLSRGLTVEADQIFITVGLSQSLHLITRVLTDPGETAWIEDPCYDVARSSLAMADLKLQPIPVDHQGLVPSRGAAHGTDYLPPRLIYVTSSYQYPLGHTLSMTRRLELLAVADRNDAWILEDDYDGEFRYHGSPIPALAGLQNNRRTIYLGTFSKVLSPTLRCSYVVVPEALVDPVRRIYPMLGNESSVATQAALAELISRGYFASHIKRMRHVYGSRRQCLEEQLQRLSGQRPRLNPGGLHIPVLTDGPDHQLAESLHAAALGCGHLSHYYSSATRRDGLLLGFTQANEDELIEACSVLEQILDKHGVAVIG